MIWERLGWSLKNLLPLEPTINMEAAHGRSLWRAFGAMAE